MADLRTRERANLPDSAFAYVDSTGRRRLPIHDEPHVRNALARFNRVLFEDDAARDRARTKLLRAAKRHGIIPVGFIDGQIRPKLPSGQLTLLFADIEGSSTLLAELEDRYGALLNAVRRIERAAVRKGGGNEVDARADEYFAVFRGAPAAVEAADAIQRAMAAHAWPDGRSVRVRIGLHTGRPTRTATGYQGMSVNAAGRALMLSSGRVWTVKCRLRDKIGDLNNVGLTMWAVTRGLWQPEDSLREPMPGELCGAASTTCAQGGVA